MNNEKEKQHVLSAMLFYTRWCLIVCFLLLWIYYRRTQRTTAAPPGPVSFPLLGSVHYLTKDIRQGFSRLASKYGPLCLLRVGTTRVLLISDYSALADSFVKQAEVFSNRKRMYLLNKITDGYGKLLDYRAFSNLCKLVIFFRLYGQATL